MKRAEGAMRDLVSGRMSQGQVSSALPGQGCQWCRPKRFPCSRSTLSPNDAHRATYCPSRSCLRGRHIHTGWCRSWAGVARVEPVHDFETGRHKGVPYGPRRDHACVPGTGHEFGPTYLLLLRARPRGTRAGGGRHSPVGATLVVARQACAAVARARCSLCVKSKRDATRASPTGKAAPCAGPAGTPVPRRPSCLRRRGRISWRKRC